MPNSQLDVVDPILGKLCNDSLPYKALLELENPPKLSWINKGYYLVRPYIPTSIRRKFQNIKRFKVEDKWFLTTKLLNYYEEILGKKEFEKRKINLWPKGKRSALVITHDVESRDGFKFIPKILDIEKKYGYISSWNIVPYLYAIDENILKLIHEHGGEIGVHGYNHDGKLFSSYDLFTKRSKYINYALHKFGADGFRSAAAQRNLNWLQDLDIKYDASCFDVDPYQPMPGGCCSIWPFKVGKYIELPYTLPQDHVLWIQRREKNNKIWYQKIDWLYENYGMILVIIHPDYTLLNNNLTLFEELLKYLSTLPNTWQILPKHLAQYWNQNKTLEQSSL